MLKNMMGSGIVSIYIRACIYVSWLCLIFFIIIINVATNLFLHVLVCAICFHKPLKITSLYLISMLSCGYHQ